MDVFDFWERFLFKNKKRVAQVVKTWATLGYVKGIGGFGAKIFVLRPEGVYKYVERAKTEIENDTNLMEKFVEFQP